MSRAADFETALLKAIRDPLSRLSVISLLARFRGKSIYFRSEGKRTRRLNEAVKMLRSMSAAEAAIVIQERWGVSERTARRDVAEARTKLKDK
jgi:hypothetical protein